MAVGTPRWFVNAACQGYDQAIFFPRVLPAKHERQRPRKGADPFAEARVICARCPVRQDCLEDSLEHGDTDGFFGGCDPVERLEIRRDRRERATDERRRQVAALADQGVSAKAIADTLDLTYQVVYGDLCVLARSLTARDGR